MTLQVGLCQIWSETPDWFSSAAAHVASDEMLCSAAKKSGTILFAHMPQKPLINCFTTIANSTNPARMDNYLNYAFTERDRSGIVVEHQTPN